jgi:hypothetical protein
MILYYVLLLVLTLFEAVGSVFLKKASGADGILALLKEPRFYLGGFLYFTAALLNIYVLRFWTIRWLSLSSPSLSSGPFCLAITLSAKRSPAASSRGLRSSS